MLIRTYCWGLIPIVCMLLYMEDGGDFMTHPNCVLAGFLRSHRVPLTAVSVYEPLIDLVPACCAPLTENGHDPVLLNSDFGIACGDGKDCRSGCVYGMNFGSTRGASTLSVGSLPLTKYEKWADPGAPYGSGHYAEICGRANHLSPFGKLGVQLTTPSASSNTLLIKLQEKRLLLVEARKERHSPFSE